MRMVLLGLVVLALSTTGCAGADVVAPSATPTAPARAEPSATSTAVPSRSPVPSPPPSPTATSTAVATATATRAPTSTPVPPTATAAAVPTRSPTPAIMTLKVYFPRIVDNDVEFVPVERKVPWTLGVGRAALGELLKGPTPEEKGRGLVTSIPPNARLLGLQIVDGVAYADFDEALQFQVGGSLRVMAIRQCITRTLLQFSTVKEVVISIEGRTEDILQP